MTTSENLAYIEDEKQIEIIGICSNSMYTMNTIIIEKMIDDKINCYNPEDKMALQLLIIFNAFSRILFGFIKKGREKEAIADMKDQLGKTLLFILEENKEKS